MVVWHVIRRSHCPLCRTGCDGTVGREAPPAAACVRCRMLRGALTASCCATCCGTALAMSSAAQSAQQRRGCCQQPGLTAGCCLFAPNKPGVLTVVVCCSSFTHHCHCPQASGDSAASRINMSSGRHPLCSSWCIVSPSWQAGSSCVVFGCHKQAWQHLQARVPSSQQQVTLLASIVARAPCCLCCHVGVNALGWDMCCLLLLLWNGLFKVLGSSQPMATLSCWAPQFDGHVGFGFCSNGTCYTVKVWFLQSNSPA